MPRLTHQFPAAVLAPARPEGWRPALRRAVAGSAGALLAAAVQFIAALLVWFSSSAADFGLFSLLMALIQLSFGLSNALVGAPLSVVRADAGAGSKRNAILTAHLLLLCATTLTVMLSGWLLGAPMDAIAAFVALAFVSNLRWAARGWALAENDVAQSARSDTAFAGAALALLMLGFAAGAATLASVAMALAAAHLAALAISSRRFLALQVAALRRPDLRRYASDIWPGQSRWATMGVLTTEASSNFHVYLIAWLFGAAGFAVIALGALFFRPLTVVLTALTQIDRPRFSRQLDSGTSGGLLKASLPIAALAWLGNALVAIVALRLFAEPIAAKGYDLGSLYAVVCAWSVIMALRAARNPVSTLLQAGRQFRTLAHCSLLSAVTSIVAVTAFAQFGPNHSLLGIVVGELVLLWLVVRLARTTQ